MFWRSLTAAIFACLIGHSAMAACSLVYPFTKDCKLPSAGLNAALAGSQNLASGTLLGRTAAGVGAPEQLTTLPSGLTIPSPSLSGAATGVYTLAGTPTISFANAACDGTTDNSTALQAALNATGGYVRLPQGQVCAFGTTLTLPSDSVIQMPSGTTLKWIGTGGTMFKTSAVAATNRAGIVGVGALGTIDANSQADIVFDIHSGWSDRFTDLRVTNGKTTTKLLKLSADVTPASAETNLAWSTFGPILVEGTVGKCIETSGLTSGPQVVTENTFNAIQCYDVRDHGIDFISWTDNNHFYNNYFSMLGASSIGAEFNSGDTGAYLGVYANLFYGLTVDCYGSVGGRTGAKFGYTYQNALVNYFQSPQCESGPFTTSAGTLSYEISYSSDSPSPGLIVDYTKGRTVSGPQTFSGGTQTLSSADGSLAALVTGATMAVRFVPSASGMVIEGVDNTGIASFQPLILGGSYVAQQISGVTKFDCNLTTLGVCTYVYPINPTAGIQNNGKLLVSPTAPTISSGFGSSPSIVAHNGTPAFEINVGTGGAASSGVVGLPTATTGWNCSATDITTKTATVFLTKQTASAANSATFTNYDAAGSAAAWVDSDKLRVSCFAY